MSKPIRVVGKLRNTEGGHKVKQVGQGCSGPGVPVEIAVPVLRQWVLYF